MSESFERRKVLLGVTGSIAAYKALELARLLVKRGYSVRAAMTKGACEFVTPLSFKAVTGSDVTVDFWDEVDSGSIGHIELADWADLVCVAPATADAIAKMVHGIADESLFATLLATKAPVLVAPAMNVNMLEHPATQENLELLRKRGVEIVDSEEGSLACGWNGTGRLAEPMEIFWNIQRAVSERDLEGKRVVVSAGPTREAVDPVRFLSNRSSGKMGMAVATEAFRRGAEVTLVHGPVQLDVPKSVNCVAVNSAFEMRDAMLKACFEEESPADLVVMTAAVSDFRPKLASEHKLKKGEMSESIELEQNPDVLAELSARRGDDSQLTLVGFAVETGELDDLLEETTRKLNSKGADMIVGNFAEDAFDLDTNRVWMIDRNGRRLEVSTSFKSRVANEILKQVRKLM